MMSLSQKSISKSKKFKALKLSKDQLIKLAKHIEKLHSKKGTNSYFDGPKFRLELRNEENYYLQNTKQLEAVLDDDIKNIKGIEFECITKQTTVSVNALYRPYTMRVSAESKGKLLEQSEAITKMLSSEKNYNWVVHSLGFYLLFSLLILIIALSAIFSFLTDSQVKEYAWFIIALVAFFQTPVVIQSTRYLERKYPLLLIYGQNIYSGKDAKKDWYWFLGFVALPFLINFLS